MKTKWGALIVDGRGKLGGHVASKNRAGSYLRTKVTPVNPNTSFQSAVRALFGAISQQWSGLTDEIRNGWNGAVSEWQSTDIFGDLKQPSGKALFQRLNNQAQVVGFAAVNSVPAKLEMVQGIVTDAVINIDDVEINLTGAYAGADARIMLSATPPLSAGTTFVKDKLRMIASPIANTSTTAPFFTAYVDKFGTPPEGANVYLSIKYVLPNGQASPEQIIKASVVVNP